MKKLFYIFLVLLVLAISAVILLVNNLDSLVRRAIEVAGTNALGTEVNVGSVELDLAGGSATLRDLSIANPSGFSNQDMVRFDELQMAIDLGSLNSEVVRIQSVRSVNPYLHYELQGTRSNVDALRERFPPAAGCGRTGAFQRGSCYCCGQHPYCRNPGAGTVRPVASAG